jgi:hypothetical protein
MLRKDPVHASIIHEARPMLTYTRRAWHCWGLWRLIKRWFVITFGWTISTREFPSGRGRGWTFVSNINDIASWFVYGRKYREDKKYDSTREPGNDCAAGVDAGARGLSFQFPNLLDKIKAPGSADSQVQLRVLIFIGLVLLKPARAKPKPGAFKFRPSRAGTSLKLEILPTDKR